MEYGTPTQKQQDYRGHCPKVTSVKALPHVARILPHHGLIALAIECLPEFGHVRNHAIYPRVRGGMGIRKRHKAQEFRSPVRAPRLTVRDEEPLLGSEPIDLHIGLAFCSQYILQRHERD